MTTEDETTETARWVANLQSINPDLTGGDVSGEVTFIRKGDELTIELNAEGVSPGMVHLAHFHGFPDARDAECPTEDADANGDGVIDLIETEDISGQTMVPFHDDPASLQIQAEGYPTANKQGELNYTQTVSVSALESALQEQLGVEEMALESRVVFIHGVPEDTELPDTAQSLPDVPPQVTVPIACGVIEPAE